MKKHFYLRAKMLTPEAECDTMSEKGATRKNAGAATGSKTGGISG